MTPNHSFALSAAYDSQAGAWFVSDPGVSQSIKMMVPGGNMLTYINSPTGNIKSFTYYRVSSTVENFWYCNNTTGRLNKIVMTSGSLTSNTGLSWPISSIGCTGLGMVYSPTRNSLIMAFSQTGGLGGVLEYLNP